MKTNIVKLILCFYIGGLLVSCSNNGEENGEVDISKKTHIVITYPEKVYSALDLYETEILESNSLRCILEIRNKGENGKTVYREEVTANAVTSTVDLMFDFELETGVYDCMIWADYVDEITKADKYYDTSDLRNVRIKDVESFLNNQACVAFYYSGELRKMDEALQVALTLKCALAKISVREENLDEFAYLEQMKVSYATYEKFNVQTGKIIGEKVDVIYENKAFVPSVVPDGTYFTIYVLADDEERTLGTCQLMLTTSSTEKVVAIVPDIINLIQGNHVKVTGNILEDKEHNTQYEITYEVDVEDWTESAEVEISPKKD